ncbi:MAG: glycine--tRNA ligase subunit beta [Acidobacteria bacterium RIFCSPLOWO2_12_FULL_54_10]|nr:MAG: glycine--tRNA ligase subunit beta [Acidobacteria bacterium RIFCSPLOWO2_12_FULL_54_10]
MIPSALADLRRNLEKGLTESKLAGGRALEMQMFSTPRRLVAYCPALLEKQPVAEELVQGPPKRIAFDADGKPTVAATQFAARMGVKVSKLQVVTSPKGEYVAVRVRHRGNSAIDVLKELIPSAVLGIYFPRTMQWEGKAGPRFIRPIRNLVALFGGHVVRCSIGSVKSGRFTFGHRQLGKPHLPVKNFSQYRETLHSNSVLLDSDARRARIREQIALLLSSEPGYRLKENPDLLETLVHLTEYPTPLLGSFDPAYLSLPEEVLITVMRGHQKYFAVEDASGKIAPRFIAVMNTDGDPSGIIRHGNERVLRARFNDARFFWESGAELRLEQRIDMLRAVTFQSQLGSYYDKAERMQALASGISYLLRMSNPAAMQGEEFEFRRACQLSKCDLTTDLVKEFTELQGVVGGLYARREGLSEEIAAAIYDHYKPESMEDELPRTKLGDLLSLADRIDTLVGYFGIGHAPSGSKDPFGLRRAANGIIRILAEKNWPLLLDGLVQAGCRAYTDAQAQGNAQSWDRQKVDQDLLPFLEDRLRFYLRDVRGFAYDEVNAVLAAGGSDSKGKNYEVVDILKRIEALARIRPTENFEPLAAAFKRMKNILQQASQAHGFSGGKVNENLLREIQEKELHDNFKDVSQRAANAKAADNYFAALEAIAALRPAVDRFFDKILVMDKNPDVRNNRLVLLQSLLNEFSTIADFSEIVPREKPSEPRA